MGRFVCKTLTLVPGWSEMQDTEVSGNNLVEAVSRWTAAVLTGWAYRLQFESLRAVAIDSHPWHGSLWVALLTENEVQLVKDNKWAIGDWRWAQTEKVGPSLENMIKRSYEGDSALSKQESDERFFLDLAAGLTSREVKKALEVYTLSDDFEFGVFNPDSPKRNYVA